MQLSLDGMPHRAQRSQSAQTKSADCCGDASVLASLLRKSRMPVVALIFCSLRSISIRTNCTADAKVALTKINTPCDHGLSRRMFGRGSGREMLGTAPMSSFTPESGHRLSVSGCPLCAKSGHCAMRQKCAYSTRSHCGMASAKSLRAACGTANRGQHTCSRLTGLTASRRPS